MLLRTTFPAAGISAQAPEMPRIIWYVTVPPQNSTQFDQIDRTRMTKVTGDPVMSKPLGARHDL